MRSWRELRESRSFNEFYFLAVALILAFGTLQFAGTVLQTDRPVVSVVSCSMHPEYQVGDILLVKGTEFEDIELDNVVVYSTPEMPIPVVHRVIEKNSDYLETQGDNTRSQHEWEKHIEPEQIHGRVALSIPRIGAIKLVVMDLTGIGGSNSNTPNYALRLDSSYLCTDQT